MKYLVAFLLLVGSTFAGERTYTFDLGPRQSVPTTHPPEYYVQQWGAGGTDIIELPYLSPSIGDLQEIRITIEQYVEYTFHYEMIHPQWCFSHLNYWGRVNHRISIEDPNALASGVHNWAINSFTQGGESFIIWTPFDGLLDFGGPSGYSSPGKIVGMHTSTDRLSGSDLDYYNGDRKGTFSLEVKGLTRFIFLSNEPLWIMGMTDYTWACIRVEYIWV